MSLFRRRDLADARQCNPTAIEDAIPFVSLWSLHLGKNFFLGICPAG